MTVPLPPYENSPSANTTQTMSDPAIATLMASMMANMEAMCVRLDKLEGERRNGGG